MQNPFNKVISLMSLLLLSFFIAPTTFAGYTIKTLGGPEYVLPNDINNKGEITGLTKDHAFRYKDGTFTDLGTLGPSYSAGIAINNHGHVTGTSSFVNPDNPTIVTDHAFLAKNDKMKDLGVLPGANYSFALDINDHKHIVGYSNDKAFVYNGEMKDLTPLLGEGYARATAINNHDVIVGEATENGMRYGFAIQNYNKKNIGVGLTPVDINNKNQITGNTVEQTGFIYDLESHNRIEFSPLPGDTMIFPDQINKKGNVVGTSMSSESASRAFIYRKHQPIDLTTEIDNNPGWVLTQATGINDKGQIIGLGFLNGENRAFIMTPEENKWKPNN